MQLARCSRLFFLAVCLARFHLIAPGNLLGTQAEANSLKPSTAPTRATHSGKVVSEVDFRQIGPPKTRGGNFKTNSLEPKAKNEIVTFQPIPNKVSNDRVTLQAILNKALKRKSVRTARSKGLRKKRKQKPAKRTENERMTLEPKSADYQDDDDAIYRSPSSEYEYDDDDPASNDDDDDIYDIYDDHYRSPSSEYDYDDDPVTASTTGSPTSRQTPSLNFTCLGPFCFDGK